MSKKKRLTVLTVMHYHPDCYVTVGHRRVEASWKGATPSVGGALSLHWQTRRDRGVS